MERARGVLGAAVVALGLVAVVTFVQPMGTNEPPQARFRQVTSLSRVGASNTLTSESTGSTEGWSPSSILCMAAALGLLFGIACGPQPAAARDSFNPGKLAVELKKSGQGYLLSETKLYDPKVGGAENFTNLEVGRWSQRDYLEQEKRTQQSKQGVKLSESGTPREECKKGSSTCAIMEGNRFDYKGDVVANQ